MKAKNIPKLIILIFMVIYAFCFSAYLVWGHEYGHAERIKELPRGERTGRIEYTEECYAGREKQNKILLYIDEDQDNIVEECATIWIEHNKLHYIRQIPDPDGVCECEGYIWLYGDE